LSARWSYKTASVAQSERFVEASMVSTWLVGACPRTPRQPLAWIAGGYNRGCPAPATAAGQKAAAKLSEHQSFVARGRTAGRGVFTAPSAGGSCSFVSRTRHETAVGAPSRQCRVAMSKEFHAFTLAVCWAGRATLERRWLGLLGLLGAVEAMRLPR